MSDAAGTPGLLATLRAAVRGSNEDLTAIPVGRAVLLFAVPMVLEMSMESLFSVVDIFFVSKLGPDAVAAVGLTESMLALVFALAMGLSAGATALIARRTGEKDAEGAAVAAVQVLAAAIALSAALGVAGAALSPGLLALMGASPDVVARGSGYTAVMLGGSVTIVLLFVVNAIFRSSGDAAAAMRSLWLANGLNIALCPCFIFGLGPFPELGVTGAAVATTLGRGVGVAYQLALLARGRGRLAVLRRHLVLRAGVLADLFRISAGAALQVLAETASWLGLTRILATYGSAALAGYTVSTRLAIFALLPPFGLANAAATLVGQNLGAGEPGRARRSVSAIARYNVAFLGAVGAAFALVPGAFVGPLADDPAVAAFARDALRIIALGFVFFAYGMVAMQAFNGAGDTTTPLLINLVSFWCFKIPLAWVLAKPLGLGPPGVFLAITAAYSLQSLIAGVAFRRGRWARRAV
ncbi:MAG TPA: MATE family efflux transporter [Polyangiaceae bacterium]|nr:MATE family efflux transporter [Polyangiaceae bacterium]